MCTSYTYTLEPGNDALFNDYSNLFNAVDSFDNPNHVEFAKEYFQSSFSYPNVDLSRDIVLVRNFDEELIASGTVLPQNNTSPTSRLMIQVHPDYRRQGIGTRILQYLIERGLERGSSTFVCRIPSFRPYVAPFVQLHGFNHDCTWVKMRLEHEKPVMATPHPWGLTVRGLNIKKELLLWAEIQKKIFNDRLNYEETNVEILSSLVKHDSFDPNLLIVGTVFNRPVGYCLGFSVGGGRTEKRLKIEGMGILPECRRKGYGQALLFEILNRAYIKGHTSSELVVLSTNQPAISMYEKCGFREIYRHMWYKKKY